MGATSIFAVANNQPFTQKEKIPTMPLFNSDDYNNLHPELNQIPTGMTDNSYTVKMYRTYMSWLTETVEHWPNSRQESEGVFAVFPDLSSGVEKVHPEDDPYLTTVLIASACFGRLLETIHADSSTAVLEHLDEFFVRHLCRDEMFDDRLLIAPLREAITTLFVSSEDAVLLFLMQTMDLAHDRDGCVDLDRAMRVARLATVGVIGILTGTEDAFIRLQLLDVLQAHVDALATEPVLPYFEGDDAQN